GSGDVTVGGPGGEQNANFIAGDGVPGSDVGISQTGGAGFEAVGNRIGIGPVDEQGTAPPGNAIMIAGEAGAEPALVGENLIWAQGMGINSSGRGAEILDNVIAGTSTGIRTLGGTGGDGNLIEGNAIRETSINGVVIENEANEVFGNEIEEVTFSAVFLKGAAEGNRIGGDTTASENFIRDSEQTPIALVLPEASQNEVGRNRGKENGSSFIGLFKANGEEPKYPNGGIVPPTFANAYQSSASGTAQPGANVRVFGKETDQGGEIASFLGEATADGTGAWTVNYSGSIPVGTNLAATQTNTLGGTSELAFAVASADPPPLPDPCIQTPLAPGCGPAPCPPMGSECRPLVRPRVTITKAPKAKSTKTTAKFVFKSSVAGSKFKCKLDKKAFANCRSPKTYKKLKPGKHVFKVKATNSAGTSPVVTRKFTVLE
ncbi:MAG TPA: NosD domain-containing protein, partial [Solirubrobacterales bacterium]|nr:NosD domain-containing protein [Solirubrobacterales bacterium]